MLVGVFVGLCEILGVGLFETVMLGVGDELIDSVGVLVGVGELLAEGVKVFVGVLVLVGVAVWVAVLEGVVV